MSLSNFNGVNGLKWKDVEPTKSFLNKVGKKGVTHEMLKKRSLNTRAKGGTSTNRAYGFYGRDGEPVAFDNIARCCEYLDSSPPIETWVAIAENAPLIRDVGDVIIEKKGEQEKKGPGKQASMKGKLGVNNSKNKDAIERGDMKERARTGVNNSKNKDAIERGDMMERATRKGQKPSEKQLIWRELNRATLEPAVGDKRSEEEKRLAWLNGVANILNQIHALKMGINDCIYVMQGNRYRMFDETSRGERYAALQRDETVIRRADGEKLGFLEIKALEKTGQLQFYLGFTDVSTTVTG